jgi:hypothetical protein
MNLDYKRGELYRKRTIRTLIILFIFWFTYNIWIFLNHIFDEISGIIRSELHQIVHIYVTFLSIIILIICIVILCQKPKTFTDKSHKINKIR